MREKLQSYAATLKNFRASLGAEDMRPLIYVEHDDKLVCTVFAGPNGKDEMLNALVACGAGMDASALTFCFDAKLHVGAAGADQDGPLNPVTGKPWQQGEMKALAEDGAAEALGIRDTLCLIRCERANPKVVEGMSLPYRIAAGTIDYLPTEWKADEIAHNMEGNFAEAMREALSRPTLGSIIYSDDAIGTLAREAFMEDELTPEEVTVHQRCAVLKMLLVQHFPFMLEPQSETEVEVYCRSFGVSREDFEQGRTIAL